MKALKYSISFALVAGFALTASCGGSSEQSDSTAGASSGGESSRAGGSNPSAGANSSAGARATAGATSGGGTGVAGGMSDGGAVDEPGGGPGVGGMSSTAGAGGGATLPMGCPAAAPTDATACTSPASGNTRCNYTGTSCRCRTTQGGGPGGDAGAGNVGREWQCNDTLVCPAAKPTAGEKCGAVQGQCAYTGAECTCGFNGNWACQNTLVCPATKPTVGDACTPAQGSCQYTGMGACACGQTAKWQCFGGNNASCPAMKPTVGEACMGNTACTYANAGCICLQQKWACN